MDIEGLEVSYKGVLDTPKDVTNDNINPSHYKQGKIEVIDFIVDQKMDYLTASVQKYLARWRFKDGVCDLKKAKWFLDKLIEQEERSNGSNSK
jgi:hypothetical protein